MKKALKTVFLIKFFCLSLVFSTFAVESAADNDRISSGTLSGFASFWFLEPEAVLPEVLKKNMPVSIELGLPNGPGFVEVRKSTFSIEGEISVTAELSVFSICEHSDASCSSSYFSAQIKLSGDTNAFCGSYFGRNDFFPLPVFFCSGPYRGGFLGITFHRLEYR